MAEQKKEMTLRELYLNAARFVTIDKEYNRLKELAEKGIDKATVDTSKMSPTVIKVLLERLKKEGCKVTQFTGCDCDMYQTCTCATVRVNVSFCD